jgi:hypothetical protein
VEQLEDRSVPAGSLLQQVSLPDFTVPPSDAAGGVSQAQASLDGRFLAYISDAPNLVAGQIAVRPENNVFLYDRQLGTTTLISHNAANPLQTADAASVAARISGDGRYVAFTTQATDLVAGQSNSGPSKNVFVYDTLKRTTTLVSHDFSSSKAGGNGDSETIYTNGFGSTNAVGRFLIFHSAATDLVPAQNGPAHQNLFVYDLALGRTVLVSHNLASTTTGANDDTVGGADISADGRYIAYTSIASDLVAGQVNDKPSNVFLYDSLTGTNVLVSGVAVPNPAGGPTVSPAEGGGDCSGPLINSDGSVVVYTSISPSLVVGQTTSNPASLLFNLFRYNRVQDTTSLVSQVDGSPTTTGNDNSTIAALSADGNTVAFISAATNLVPGQGSIPFNVFLYSTTAAAQGLPAVSVVSHASGNRVTAAGGIIPYQGLRQLDVSTFGSPFQADSNQTNRFLGLSPDGRYVCYQSGSALVANETGADGQENTFLFDGQSGTNTLVSGAGGPGTVSGDDDSFASLVTSDGSVVVLSLADNLLNGIAKADGSPDIFEYAPGRAAPTLVTRAASSASPQSLVYSTSADGNFVLFTSDATNVVRGEVDTNLDQNVYLLDRSTGTMTLVSHAADAPTRTANRGSPGSLLEATIPSVPAVISADGNWVAFVSAGDDLVPNEYQVRGNYFSNVYLYNRLAGQITLASGENDSPTLIFAASSSFRPAISADGSYVSFTSTLRSFQKQVYLYDRKAGHLQVVSANADSDSDYTSISDNGNLVAFQSRADNLMTGGQAEALGAGAGGLGYGPDTPSHTTQPSIPDSVAVKFDLYNNAGEGTDSTGLYLNGASPSAPAVGMTGSGINLQSGDPVQVTLSYDGATLAEFLRDLDTGGTFATSYPVNIPQAVGGDTAYVGFTGGTGGLTSVQSVQTWSFTGGSLTEVDHSVGFGSHGDLTANGSAAFVGNSARLTDGGYYEAGSVFTDEPVDVTGFTTTFTFVQQPGTSPMADGLTFTIENAPLGTTSSPLRHAGNNIFLFNRTSQTTLLVSHGAPGSGAAAGNDNSLQPVISPDGSSVAFTSYATNLVAGQNTSPFSNVFLYRVASGTISLVSGRRGSPSVSGSGSSDSPALSVDGSIIAFRSDAPDLIAGESGPLGSNIFLFDSQPGAVPLTLVSHAAGSLTTRADGSSTEPVIDGDGQLVAYLSTAGDLVPGQSGAQVNNVFGWAPSSGKNFLASGAQGSVTVASAAPAFSPLLSRDPVLLFNVVGSLFQGPGKFNAYANRLIDIAFTPAALLDGSPAGTAAGTLSVITLFVGEAVLPQYSLPAGGAPDNGLFAVGTTRLDGTTALLTQFLVSVAGQSSFTILVQAATGLGVVERLFILTTRPSNSPNLAHPLMAELHYVRVGKHKTLRLMVEVFDLATGAEVEALACPFQAPRYRGITLTPLGNGLYRLSARKGRHTVTTLLTA